MSGFFYKVVVGGEIEEGGWQGCLTAEEVDEQIALASRQEGFVLLAKVIGDGMREGMRLAGMSR
jgi:hypothetical protein